MNNNLITVKHEDGAAAVIVASSLPVWSERGWSRVDAESVEKELADQGVSAKLLRAVAETQPSDVTAPGESKVEGVAPSTPPRTRE